MENNKHTDLINKFMKRMGSNIDLKKIDELVVSDANILRPVIGHAFEVIFDEVITDVLKGKVFKVGGDSSTDRVVQGKNGKKYTVQIKTLISKGIKKNEHFTVSLHKTHGQEKRPKNLYPIEWPCRICEHDGQPFPDFLVVPHPTKGIIIIPKENIPESKSYRGHLADPVKFKWENEWINRWDLLGYDEFKGKSLQRTEVPEQKIFKKISKKTLLTDEEILMTWLEPENFRMIDMNLRGNLREPILTDIFKDKGVILENPEVTYSKYDRISKPGGKRIQIKGPSKHLTDLSKNIIGAEVMGTHGKNANRRYNESDFDYFGFVIDPADVLYNQDVMNDKEYHFCLIPVTALPLHYKNKEWGTKEKLYDTCKFIIEEQDGRVYLKPATNYRNGVKFRKDGPWFIDEIPQEFYD